MLTEKQLLERRSGLGGSEIAAIVGEHPWLTPMEIWADKTGRMERDADSLALRFGSFAEDFVVKEFTRATGKRVERFNKTLRHRKHPVMVANIDRLVVPEGLRQAFRRFDLKLLTREIVEAKTSARGDAWGPDGSNLVPAYYAIQSTWYMHITETERTYVPVLIGGADFRVLYVDYDADLAAMLVAAAEEWWERHIVEDEPPEPRSRDDLALLYPRREEKEIEADADALLTVEALREVKDRMTALEEERAGLEVQLMAAVKDGTVLKLGDTKLATVRQMPGRTSIDMAALRRDHPDLFEKYAKTGKAYTTLNLGKQP